jgi:hypothetical protein
MSSSLKVFVIFILIFIETIINLYYARDHHLETDDMAADGDLMQLPLEVSQTGTSSVVCT